MRSLVIFPFVLLMAACAGLRPSSADQLSALQSGISKVTLEDGISASEANAIAAGYFFSHVAACGLAHDVGDGGDVWISRTSLGYAGMPGEDIRVSKTTGEVSSPGSPTVGDPKSITVLPPSNG